MDHEEIVRRYGPWVARSPTDVSTLFADYPGRWWVAGGWAIEAFTGVSRPHGDVDPGIPREDVALLLAHVGGDDVRRAGYFDVWAADQGTLRPLVGVDAVVPSTCSNLWLRHAGSDPWEYDVLLTDVVAGTWSYKRDHRIRMSFSEVLHEIDDIRFLRPAVQLLLKAPGLRPQDQADFDACRPLLTDEERRWLREALDRAHPGHPWAAALR